MAPWAAKTGIIGYWLTLASSKVNVTITWSSAASAGAAASPMPTTDEHHRGEQGRQTSPQRPVVSPNDHLHHSPAPRRWPSAPRSSPPRASSRREHRLRTRPGLRWAVSVKPGQRGPNPYGGHRRSAEEPAPRSATGVVRKPRFTHPGRGAHLVWGLGFQPQGQAQEGTMSATPPLSIGLPVYNGEDYLEQSVDALLGQTFGDFELILLSNASTDGDRRHLQALRARGRAGEVPPPARQRRRSPQPQRRLRPGTGAPVQVGLRRRPLRAGPPRALRAAAAGPAGRRARTLPDRGDRRGQQPHPGAPVPPGHR